MPHRKLVKIGEEAQLPTIGEFFTQMAERQHEEIRRLKTEVADQPLMGELNPHPVDSRKPVPDPWLLHPVRVKKSKTNKKTAAKSAGRKPSKRKTKSAKKTARAKRKKSPRKR